MDDILVRIWENLGGRVGGPLTFRIIIQPVIALVLAIRDGMKDARQGKPAYLWAIAGDAAHRRELLHQGWKSVAKVFILAVILDAIYQWIAFRWIYPAEVLIVGALLALLPYLLIRGPANRIARMIMKKRGGTGNA